MAIALDHLILAVSDRPRSIAFYTSLLGFAREPDDGPFAVLRIDPGFVIQMVQSDTQGGEHLAFALSKREFESVFARLVEAEIPYGDRFDTVGTMQGPGEENGARGPGPTLYFFDPDRHLLEIRHYEAA